MRSPELEQVFQHLRDIKRRATEFALARDMVGYRRVIHGYGAINEATSQATGESTPAIADGVSCEWVRTESSDPARRLLYVHGGGWISGDIESYRPLTGRIAEATGCSVLAVDYRLAPEHPFPAGLEDVLAAYTWMLNNGPEGPGEASKIYIAGDSAGGNLTLAATLSLRDAGTRLPDAVVGISPATDFTASGDSCKTRADVDPIIDAARVGSAGKAYYGDRDPVEPLLSPLFAELAGFPPLLLHVGDAETLLDDSVRFAHKARESGVDATLKIWPGMPHVFHVFAPYLEESLRAIDEIGEFIRSY
ncbi:MAG: alpha/beta hydrolase [Candidatus Hydrogenedentes bacterium]|nr:alpha/beta hydrolase [Candidatus Hydrogenedentota bacterium]